MPHSIFGRKLSRDTDQRLALLKGLAGALIRSEAIETTEAKAKAARDLIENLITKARRATLNDIRLIESVITDKELVYKLVHDIAPRFKTRAGGYLRLIRMGIRSGDNATMVRMELVSPKQVSQKPNPKSKSSSKKSSPKK
ncbi:50S ribosomal protein L17 [Candidatus Amesbacteria bacterium RIFCSPHIGHO2_02_FULL_47_9]|uniref:50S ribosomal protein L17 n=1 Tax=Candidatus Amesbacteria bacterium RIFCSPHIGHO2_01_FULL_48_32b TaxID=1797253 RepID=A0A1F4YGD5_9BACT|nr:MAG: 50S ribosomal protein L17 [Candidatus Amesbacteria bacterium RIFCSPHIGHO2_01_FULL_48_32b]OGD04171.1 MAG: 50S ribosomal protein L17 [Candidatus Amesbacteria bacterium RIFCSPHIGHO2_02_FULL_47_9]OGD07525.1 MAG: 50S ribosomal protein L17 [Candidatus Amesbacteria bacterium RIFCSPLOWO2_01_FULL_49_25]